MRMPKLCAGVIRSSVLGLGLSVWVSLTVSAQDLLPTALWNTESGNWSSAGSWDPEAPTDGHVAAIRNGGTANVGTADTVHALSVISGTIALGNGADLTVNNETVVGSDGVVSFGGGSLTTDVFGISGGTIDVAGSLVDGLGLGDTLNLFSASTVGGAARSVTVDGSAPDLGDGLRLSFVTDAAGGGVVVESNPVLTVDRLTGATTIVNGAGNLDIKGYSISSPNGLLARDRNNYISLQDQDLPGWDETTTTNSLLAEFNLSGMASLSPNQELDFGTPWVDGVGSSPSDENLSWEYLTADGRVIEGSVEFNGPISDLVLNIDPETGSAELRHDSPLLGGFDITGITLGSSSGSLEASGYEGFGGDWDLSPNNDESRITEVNLTGSVPVSNGTAIPLGDLFDTDGAQDVTFRYALSNGIQANGSVVYGLSLDPVGCAPINALLGDLDGDGSVAFGDFLVLSSNFGTQTQNYGDGDVDCDGTVAFGDFLVLSSNFGQTLGAATSVPEPSGAMLLLLGILGMMKFRKSGRNAVLAVAVVATVGLSTQDTYAQFSGRLLRIHPQAVNAGIDSVAEFQQILNGELTDVIINEDFTFEFNDIVDFGGGEGSFPDFTLPYPEGPNGTIDDDMNTFGMVLEANVTIPAGDYAIGCGSDDGCWIRIDGVSFTETFNENGTSPSDGVIFNGGRGHAFTSGNFTVESDLETTFVAGFFENGGGDSFEVALTDFHIDATDIWGEDVGFELEDGLFDWEITPGSFTGPNPIPGDFNADGVVDLDDERGLDRNFGTNNPDGDFNLDGIVDLNDVWLFSQALEASAPAGAAVNTPEPSSALLSMMVMLGLLVVRPRRG